MPDDHEQQAPEILKQIQAAERQVEGMLRQAQQDAEGVIERARAQAEALRAEKRHAREERKEHLLAEGAREAAREAERIILGARLESGDLKGRCLARADEAVDLVLRRILPLDR